MVRKMMSEIGKPGYSNHSLRATTATRLYEAGHDNQAICSVTGHRSKSVEVYKRINERMQSSIQSSLRMGSGTSKTEATKSDVDGLFVAQGNKDCVFNINVNISKVNDQ